MHTNLEVADLLSGVGGETFRCQYFDATFGSVLQEIMGGLHTHTHTGSLVTMLSSHPGL